MPALSETLQRIAVLLDCSVESLTEPSGEASREAGASELVALWFEIDDAGAREQLLRFARRLVPCRGAVVSLR